MKVFAVHDEAGNIAGLAIRAQDVEDGEVGVTAGTGNYVTEIDVPDTRDRPPQEVLADLARNHRVERLATPGRFVETRVGTKRIEKGQRQ
jgi:hypothetical protein